MRQDIVILFCSNASTLKLKTSKHKRNQSLDVYKIIQSFIKLDRGSYGNKVRDIFDIDGTFTLDFLILKSNGTSKIQEFHRHGERSCKASIL